MQLFKSDTPVRLASLSGHVVVITPDKPAPVPDHMHAEAYAAGCRPVDSDEPAPQALSAEDREAAIQDAIRAMIAKNDPKDFNVDGSPKAFAVRRAVSFAPSAEEVRNAFEAMSLGV